MSEQPSPARTRKSSTALWVVIILILLPPMVLPVWVPLYDKEDPELWGFPFFYWFQTALIILSVVCTGIAYWLSLVADRRDREERSR
jgi:hypothetical protein